MLYNETGEYIRFPMFNQFIFVIFFVYGLAFFGMGIAMALETGRSPALAEGRILRPLAAFGLIHGIHEWMESYLLQAQSLGMPLPIWLPWFGLGLLILSFSSLMIFAINLLKLTAPNSGARRLVRLGSFLFYSSAILLSAYLAYRTIEIPWLNLLDGMSRYLLAVPASLLATIALRAWAREVERDGRTILSIHLILAAVGFGIYALTQFVNRPLQMFPAQLINEGSFLSVFGFPIQVVRTLAAVWITIHLLRATNSMEEVRRGQLIAAQQSQLEALQRQEALRRDLLSHTVRVQEEERARIARELHDETAQELSAFSLELAALRSMLKRQKVASEKVEHLQNLSRRISQGVYRLVRDLRPAELDDLGLVAALRYLIGQYHLSMKVDAAFKIKGDVRRLEPALETTLFRVVQEALANVARHAGTRDAEVELNYREDSVHLMVIDGGQGFDVNGRFTAPRGWGLAGMRERVESVGGEFRLISAPGEGTKIEVSIRLAQS
jgi:signal transduction histidine kinase